MLASFLMGLVGGQRSMTPLAAVAVALMRSQPDPEGRPRLILGAAMTTLPLFDFTSWDAKVAASAGLDDVTRLPAITSGTNAIGTVPDGSPAPSPCQRTTCCGRAGGPHSAGDTGPNSTTEGRR